MSLSNLPLSYCTNVHPGRTVAEIEQGLDRYTVNVAAQFGAPLAAGLWLAAPVVKELLHSDTACRRFAAGLAQRSLTCHTLNAFPFGDFHSPRVKEHVYRPSWAERQRLEFTVSAARILVRLLPPDVEGSISTLPLGYPGIDSFPDFHRDCVENLIDAAVSLHRLEEEFGRTIRLAIEPEPCCWLDETPSAIDFFTNRLWPRAAQRDCLDAVRRHVGLCLDVCHQAVAFEDMRQSVAEIDRAGIRMNKIHITCAIELENPAANLEGRRAWRTMSNRVISTRPRRVWPTGACWRFLTSTRRWPTHGRSFCRPSGGASISTFRSTRSDWGRSRRRGPTCGRRWRP